STGVGPWPLRRSAPDPVRAAGATRGELSIRSMLGETGGSPPADQAVASRSYGRPSAAGGVLRPIRPVRTTIVAMYGRALNTWAGIAFTIVPRSPTGGRKLIVWPSVRKSEKKR